MLKQKEQSELAKFLNYFLTQNSYDEYTQEVQHAVAKAKYNLDWRKDYMTLDYLLEEAAERAKKEGQNLEKIKNVVIAVNKFHIPKEDVAKEYNVPLNELNAALAECN